MKNFLRISILVLVCLSTACNYPQARLTDPAPGPAAWIDAPQDESNLPLAEYQVVSHASDPNGISQFELSVDGQVLRTDPAGSDQAGNALVHISQAWLPAKAGLYLLSVRAANKSGIYGPYAYAHVTVGQVTDTPTFTPTPPASPTPVASSTDTPTPTSVVPLAVGLINTNCHDGPGTAYFDRDVLMKGQSLPIDGISQDKQWVRIRRPDGNPGGCWVYLPGIQVNGDLGGVHTLIAPTITPTATPVPSATPVPTRSSPLH